MLYDKSVRLVLIEDFAMTLLKITLQLYVFSFSKYLFKILTVDLVNLPSPQFADPAFFRICWILIHRSWSYVIGKLKTDLRCSCIYTYTVPQEDRVLVVL